MYLLAYKRNKRGAVVYYVCCPCPNTSATSVMEINAEESIECTISLIFEI